MKKGLNVNGVDAKQRFYDALEAYLNRKKQQWKVLLILDDESRNRRRTGWLREQFIRM